jgi:hypothetical protein
VTSEVSSSVNTQAINEGEEAEDDEEEESRLRPGKQAANPQ